MEKAEERIVWCDIPCDWYDNLKDEYPDLSENELWDMVYSVEWDYFRDLQDSLDIRFSQPIIVIADIGRWNGRFSGYKLIESGNVRDCFHSDSDCQTKWYIDENDDFRAVMSHHDGTNYLLYRVFKDDMTEEKIEDFCDKIYENRLSNEDIEKYTDRLGGIIADTQGFCDWLNA